MLYAAGSGRGIAQRLIHDSFRGRPGATGAVRSVGGSEVSTRSLGLSGFP
jgi:hypothetical protein